MAVFGDGPFDGTVQGVAVDGENNGGSNGRVVLTILDGEQNVEKSNFGANAFQLTNTGNKEIAAVLIDIRTAVFADQVFDIDGTAGDRSYKAFGIDTDGGTGAFFVGENGVPGNNADNLFFAGATPLPDTSGLSADGGTAPISGGHRGLLIRFDGSMGGFDGGETVGFSGDGDSNSIAGFVAALLNPHNVTDTNFDTGGQSGAELVGSSFTVLFADGTMATGYLGSDTTQAGAAGEAVQGRAERTATLSINTGSGVFASGDAGTYGGALPEITVSGTAGDKVRVTLHKGFQPVDASAAGSPDLVSEVIQARLDQIAPDFAVNNAFDVQTVDVIIGANGTATVPGSAFDYINTISGETFPDQAFQPIALTAAVVLPVTVSSAIVGTGRSDLVPAGPVSAPIYLTNPTRTPAEGDIVVIVATATISGDTDVSEPDGTATYTVTLNEAPTNTTLVTVEITPSAGSTAMIPGDAVLEGGVTRLTLTFAPGGPLSQSFDVDLFNDTLPESAESFDVTISDIAITNGGAATVTTTIGASDGALDGIPGGDRGDLSDDGTAPTDLGTFALGDTSIIASQQGDAAPGGRDRDFFTFTVGEGLILSGLYLDDWDALGSEPAGAPGFLGLGSGSQILGDPEVFAQAADLLGGYFYGEADLTQARNLLEPLGDGAENGVTFGDGTGFTDPLLAGDYTVWLNQDANATRATLRFVIEQEPPENLPPVRALPVDPIVVEEDMFVSVSAAFTDPENAALSYAFDAGAPAWLAIDAFGTVSGTPGADDVVASLPLTIIATDPLGAEGTVEVLLTVTAKVAPEPVGTGFGAALNTVLSMLTGATLDEFLFIAEADLPQVSADLAEFAANSYRQALSTFDDTIESGYVEGFDLSSWLFSAQDGPVALSGIDPLAQSDALFGLG